MTVREILDLSLIGISLYRTMNSVKLVNLVPVGFPRIVVCNWLTAASDLLDRVDSPYFHGYDLNKPIRRRLFRDIK